MKSYKEQEMEESHDHPYHAGTQHIEKILHCLMSLFTKGLIIRMLYTASGHMCSFVNWITIDHICSNKVHFEKDKKKYSQGNIKNKTLLKRKNF